MMTLKVFLIHLKKSKENLYVLRATQKEYSSNLATDYLEEVLRERSIGFLAKKCPFLVETLATFESEVNYLFKIIYKIKIKVFKNLKSCLPYVNEFVTNGSLASHLEILETFNEDQVKFFSAQVVIAMLFLHENGFINL